MKTIKQLRPKLKFISKAARPILGNVKVTDDSIICSDLETFVKIKNNYGLTQGLHAYKTLGLILDGRNSDDYPDISFNIKSSDAVLTTYKVLKDLLRHSGDDETRPFLESIAIDNNHLVATNGYTLKAIECGKVNGSYILPKTSINVLLGLLKGFKVSDVTLLVDNDYCVVDNEFFTIKIRLILRNYPKWQPIIPTKFKHSFTVTDWIDYKELKPLFGDRSKTCIIKGDGVNVTLTPKDYPHNNYSIAEWVSEKFEIGFNIEYLHNAINGCKSFEFKFNDELSPVMINDVIVMPIRL